MDIATPASKSPLRTTLRAARLAFAADAPPIVPPAAFMAALAGRRIIAGYLPLPGEADPSLLMMAAIDAGLAAAMPFVISRQAPMRFLAWTPDAPLVAGPFGLRQPLPTAVDITPDIILAPLLGFDRALNRLGQGAGHYDRAFAALPAVLRIGVAWSIQRIDRLPVDPWDASLHGVITEQGWIDPERHA